MIIEIISEAISRQRSSTYRLVQSSIVLGAWLSPPQGAWFAASYHKALDDAFGLLHKACSMQQGTHQGAWQSVHFVAPRSSDCQQSYTRHETSRKTDWQLPINFKARLVRCRRLLNIGKQQQKKLYLGIFKAPLHGICELLYIVYRQQWIIKELVSQLLLGRLWHRLEGYYSNGRTSRSFSFTTAKSISIWGTLSSCGRCMLGCFRVWLIWCPVHVYIHQIGSWFYYQPNYRRLGGWSSSCLWTTLHLVAKILDLILLMGWEILDPSQAKFKIRKLRQIGSN